MSLCVYQQRKRESEREISRGRARERTRETTRAREKTRMRLCVYKQREEVGVRALARERNKTCQPEVFVLCFYKHLSRTAEVLVGTPPSARGNTSNTERNMRVREQRKRRSEREQARARASRRKRDHTCLQKLECMNFLGGAPVDVLAVDGIGAFQFDLHSKLCARYSSNA